jgi:signal transduction histidine kinase
MEPKKIEILVVEDSLTQAEVLKYILKKNNYSVRHAIDGQKALEILNQFKPDIIISDIVMPGMDGYRFCSIVKADDSLKKIPVILLTALSDPRDVIKGLECGADSFLVKPYSEEFLITRIQYFIQNTELRKNQNGDRDLEILFANQNYTINSSPRQLLDVLLTTYENSILKNKELIESNKNLKIAQDNLNRLNTSLEQQVKVRTQELGNTTENLLEEIKDRKLTEESLLKSEARLHELNATKDKFFSIIAHDLKNPFNSIIGFSDLLLEKVQEKDYDGIEEFAGQIRNSSQLAMDLLTNLLEWSRAQTGKIEFTPESVEIGSLIDEVTQLLNDTAKQKSITISDKNRHNASVIADKNMITSILRNLVSNAIKFTHPGGQIVISTEQMPNECLVTVSDNGVGIKQETIEKLFRIDQNSSTMGTQNEKGTGLGLLLCKEFIEKHSGKIWVESDPGKGSKFHFTIPKG